MPALRALRARFPDSPIVLAAHGPAAALLQEAGVVERGLPFDDPSLAWVFGGAGRPETLYARAIAWIGTPSPLLEGRLWAGVESAVMIHPSKAGQGSDTHVARHLLDALSCFGVEARLDTSPLPIKPRSSTDILLHPGSGAPRKNWPAERFARVLARLRESGESVKLVVGEADGAAAEAVERAAGTTVPRVEEPLGGLAAYLAGTRAYLGNDSGVSHLAGLCGTRTFALFGPTDPRIWSPLGPYVTTLPFDVAPDRVVELLRREGDSPMTP